jgi:RNA 2',3'-cyclic 3'-phosphodiesterase
VSAGGTVVRGDRLRLFLALQLPADVVERLAAWQAAELPRGRLVPPEHLHVTLAFLGPRPADDLPRVLDVLREIAAPAPRPLLAPVRYRETRSVGMVVLDDEGGRGAALADALGQRLEELGLYRREQRPWLAHVTVLRFRERPRLRPPLPPLEPFAPSEAAAYLSRLHPSGARYEVLDSVPLGG